jgi:adenylylsulfate kinase-like enzyme
MTSELESRGPQGAPILWITGLSGVGKSTLAQAVAGALRADGQRPLVLDGDEMRELLEAPEHQGSHHPEQRLHRAWRMARMARWAALQGIPVIVATISLRHDVQAWSRAGPAPYAEVLLRADLDLLRRRKPSLYGPPGGAPAPHVVGIDVAAEYPRRAELILQQDFADGSLTLHQAQTLGLWRALCRPDRAQT